MKDRFTQVTFKNYKALKQFSLTLNEFNVLVGPNNAGKSTIIGAFKILAEGMRKATARKAEYVALPGIKAMAYHVPLEELPVATENIFTNYNETEPAIIEFTLSSGNRLRLIFPENNVCYLVCASTSKQVATPAQFRSNYNVSVGFVPVLGPVEHNEPLFQKEAARQALQSHRASRNFRNIWFHYPEDFDAFRDLIKTTWPGMDIDPPEVDRTHDKPILHMFCPEERYPREIFWSGFGFQVWCQMLTYIVRSRDDSLLIIDEPDIYLHSDLQRQLVEILRQAAPDILIATHSVEIIAEADPGDLVIINKKNRSGKRISNPSQIQTVLGALGSNLNPILTQLAKSRRVVFVEGKDFQIIAALARKLNFQSLANRSDFAVIPVEGFNPERVRSFSEGMELTLGTSISKGIIFDRDFRSPKEITNLASGFQEIASFFHVHERKEIENYLLIPNAIERAIKKRLNEKLKRTGGAESYVDGAIVEILLDLSNQSRHRVAAQFITKRSPYVKASSPSLDVATINQSLLEEFEQLWSNLDSRLKFVPGKDLMSELNTYLQDRFSVTVSPSGIINEMKINEIPNDMVTLLESLESFRKASARPE